MYAEVIIDISHGNVDRLFTYAISEDADIRPGHRVLVPFGAGNKKIEGFVMSLAADPPAEGVRIKTLIGALEPYTVLSEEQIALARWMKESYNCLLIDALRLMIPAQLRGGRVRVKTERTVKIAEGVDSDEMLRSMLKKDGTPRAPKQSEVLTLLSQAGCAMSTKDITAFIPSSAGAIKALIDKGILAEEGHVTFRSPYAGVPVISTEPLSLTAEQEKAFTSIAAAMDERKGAFLLHGVTGSGKTEVYMQAIAKALAEGGSAIVLVPEIALTPQAMDRFRGRFGNEVAVLHSRLSVGERYDEWRRLRLGKARVAVGARSAVFAPLSDIRLIVVDEEHEPSYQSETAPRYSAVDAAAMRCRLNGAALVLGSATPSLSTYLRAKRGRYELLELTERVKELPMPEVEIADMRGEFASGNTSIFSAALYSRLKACLDSGGQAILFMNRRGYSTFVSCRGCGYVFKCGDCDVSMTYHKLDGRMKCHYCGASAPVPKVCPECGKPYIKYFGIGTEQVEEQLREAFPGVVSLRMDMDTTGTKNAHYDILSRFAAGEAQVLIGTQMVAKGLDIANVTLVGVIAADATLYIPDYRSAERTFQLLTQVAGRAGRDERGGHVVIQTYSPDHPAVTMAAAHDYKAFYEYESAARRAAMFPPYSLFVRALFTGTDEAALSSSAERFCSGLHEAVTSSLKSVGADVRELLFIEVSPAPIRRREGLYRYQVLLKLARTKHTAGTVRAIYEYSQGHRMEGFRTLDVNPSDMF